MDRSFDIISKNHINSNPEQYHWDKCKSYDWLDGSQIAFVKEDFLKDSQRYINNTYDKGEKLSGIIMMRYMMWYKKVDTLFSRI